jgi:hypothetical protein
MSRTHKDSPENRQARNRGGRMRRRNISVRGIHRDPPDLRKLSRALIALALAESEADAQAQSRQGARGGVSSEESADDR